MTEAKRMETRNHNEKSKTGINLIFALAFTVIFICFLALQFWF